MLNDLFHRNTITIDLQSQNHIIERGKDCMLKVNQL